MNNRIQVFLGLVVILTLNTALNAQDLNFKVEEGSISATSKYLGPDQGSYSITPGIGNNNSEFQFSATNPDLAIFSDAETDIDSVGTLITAGEETIHVTDFNRLVGEGSCRITIGMTTEGPDLWPAGFLVGGTEARQGGFFIGTNAGGIPLTFTADGPIHVIQATIGGESVNGTFGPHDITHFDSFRAGEGGGWDGSVGVIFSAGISAASTGRLVNQIELNVSYTQGTLCDSAVLPGNVSLSSPANNSSDLELPLTLSWQASSNADAHVLQVSKESSFATRVFDNSDISGTSRELNENHLEDDTNYYWRVKGRNGGGDSPWSEVWTFKTVRPLVIPTVATLSSPANNSLDLEIPLSLSWQASANADVHILQVSKESNFATRVFDNSDISGTSRELNENHLEDDTNYYWRVKGRNGDGDSPWSEIWTFKTVRPLVLPTVATLSSPANNSMDLEIPLSLSWQASANADVHVLQVSKESNFATRVLDNSDISGTSRELNENHLEDDTSYYWRVKGRNGDGDSPWSEVWTFKTVRPLVLPTVATLSSPANNSMDLEIPLSLSWQASANANVHVLQVSKESNFTALVFDNSNISGTSWELNENHLEEGTSYYWRVKGRNGDGDSPWSEVWTFVTKSPAVLPGLVDLIGPGDGAQGVGVPVTFEWQQSSDAQQHLLNISKDSGFSSLVFEKNDINGTSHDLGFEVLEDGTNYFWRVKGRNDDGDSPWSPTWSFTSFQRQYAIGFEVGIGGSISVSDTSYVNHGDSLSFSITPDQGYVIADVLVDAVSQGAVEEYTFENVVAAHAVAIFFASTVDEENENPDALSRIEIYPNPVRGTLHFNTNRSLTSLKVFDSLGRQALSITDQGQVNNLDVSALPVGLYHIEIVDQSGDRSVKTIAKIN